MTYAGPELEGEVDMKKRPIAVQLLVLLQGPELSIVGYEAERNLIYLEGLCKISRKRKQLNEIMKNE